MPPTNGFDQALHCNPIWVAFFWPFHTALSVLGRPTLRCTCFQGTGLLQLLLLATTLLLFLRGELNDVEVIPSTVLEHQL